MAGAIDKKIAEVKKELEDSPSTHLSARNGILNSFAQTSSFNQSPYSYLDVFNEFCLAHEANLLTILHQWLDI